MEDEKEKEILTKALTSVKLEKNSNEDEDIVSTYSFFFAVASFVNILYLIAIALVLFFGVYGAIEADSISVLLIYLLCAAGLWFIRLINVYAIKWFGYMLKTNYDTSKYLRKK